MAAKLVADGKIAAKQKYTLHRSVFRKPLRLSALIQMPAFRAMHA